MKMKYAISAFLLALALILPGCGSSAGENETLPEAETTSPVTQAAPLRLH